MVDVIMAVLSIGVVLGGFALTRWIDRKMQKQAMIAALKATTPRYITDKCVESLEAKETRRPLEQLIDGKRWP